jgi:hypothetical protein
VGCQAIFDGYDFLGFILASLVVNCQSTFFEPVVAILGPGGSLFFQFLLAFFKYSFRQILFDNALECSRPKAKNRDALLRRGFFMSHERNAALSNDRRKRYFCSALPPLSFDGTKMGALASDKTGQTAAPHRPPI